MTGPDAPLVLFISPGQLARTGATLEEARRLAWLLYGADLRLTEMLPTQPADPPAADP